MTKPHFKLTRKGWYWRAWRIVIAWEPKPLFHDVLIGPFASLPEAWDCHRRWREEVRWL